ncbi:uncharacterized protein PAN0_003d1977 [Moesziomyces antarcticus]|uniref:Uncharacterized protein n=1 Tax=Pseudozyma antarctica TaxID=84753 RepID=A0A5C3FIZ9_PSEA2|nr:uncharacterized protein PAN0_003d1977 [Moesziomyces antarcticus]GAK63769.1 conserved hypothetical protein [Moesziomyces antarcticus]SPO44372.1 uncharacterized protein PSANT_02057 [Moesziomyces antarcticus]
MALDAALFTLQFVRRRNEPSIVDIYPSSAGSSASTAPPVPSKDTDDDPSKPASSKPTPFTGTIPDVAAQRALALEYIDYSKLTPSYTRVRATNYTQYSSILLDGLIQDCLLASISQPYTGTKKKHIQLYNPDAQVELEKRSMTFQQSWRFHFGDVHSQQLEEFSWKREGSPSRGSSTQSAYVCEVIRKPDPSVLAAQYRPPVAKGKPGTLQLMDYNLNRLDVQDKKGLEVALVMTLSALLDQEYDDKIAARGEHNLYMCTSGIPTDLSMQGYSAAWREMEARHQPHASSSVGNSGPRPSTPGGRQPSLRRNTSQEYDAAMVDRIASLEPNEMLVSKWGAIDGYVEHALSLLRCDAGGQSMYLIALHSDSPETAPKLVQIAAAIKAAYYRLPDDAKGTVYGRPASTSGIEDELYQYVQTLDAEAAAPSTPTPETASRRRVIRLDPPSPNEAPSSPGSSARQGAASYKPPSKLKLILSKERIQELEPKRLDEAQPTPLHPTQPSSSPARVQANAGLNVPPQPPRPSRPTSPAAPPEPQPERGGKGKALLSKLGLHH